MKNNIKISSLLTILISMVMGGCSTDFIEEKRDLSAVTNEVYEYEELSNQYVNELYNTFLPDHNKNMVKWDRSAADHGGDNQFSLATDEFAEESDLNAEYATVDNTQDHCIRTIGDRATTSYRNDPYTRLRKINLYFDQVDNFTGLKEDFKDQVKGQLYFWRAWQYFELTKLYGGVPLVLTAQDPIIVEGGGSDIQVQRSSASEMIDQITKDLDSSYTYLDRGRPYTEEDYGRITKEAARAFKGRVLLTWASPQFNRNDNPARWQRAYDACIEAKEACDAAGKGLHPDWRQMFFDGETNSNMEAIIVYNFNDNQAFGDYSRNNATERYSRPNDLGASGGNSPTKQIVDAFPMKDGTPYDASGDLTDFYKDRDPRFYHSFVYSGAEWPYEEDPDYKHWTYSWSGSTAGELDRSTQNNPNASGIYLKKFTSDETSELGGFRYVPTSYLEFRYAEVLLNLAEAAVGVERLDEAKDYVRQIRERAGIEQGSQDYGLSTVMTRDEHFAMCINERKVEFAYENKRFWDLRRWLLYDDTFGTVTRLNQTPIAGMRRKGYYTVALNSDGTEYITNSAGADPFQYTMVDDKEVPPGIIDRDANPEDYPSGVTTHEEYVDYLYDNHFKVIVRDDLEEDENWSFTWFEEYYFFGLHESLYSEATYLEQTQGWGGAFDPLQ